MTVLTTENEAPDFVELLERELSRVLLAAGITSDDLRAELTNPTTTWNQMNVLMAHCHMMGQVATLAELHQRITGADDQGWQYAPKG